MGVYKEPYKKDPDEAGAIWIKEGASGEYLSISIGDERYVAFKNKFKKEAKHPDWIVKRSKPREQPPEPTGEGDSPF